MFLILTTCPDNITIFSLSVSSSATDPSVNPDSLANTHRISAYMHFKFPQEVHPSMLDCLIAQTFRFNLIGIKLK